MNINRKPRSQLFKRPETKSVGDPSAPLKPIKELVLGILSPEEMIANSATPEGIHVAQLYNVDGTPTMSGLLDPRQGVVDKSSKCRTCLGQMGDCPGHFGHIELAEPVFHASFLPKIVKILRCVCYYCYEILVSPENPRFQDIMRRTAIEDRRRFTLIHTLCKGKSVCDRYLAPVEIDGCEYERAKKSKQVCGRKQPKIKQQGLELVLEWERLNEDDAEKKQILHPKLVMEILRKITDETCTVLGMDPRFSRPEWMVATVIVVPPISIRPIAITFSGGKSQDDLTYKLADIVNSNNDLIAAKKERAPYKVQEELLCLLQYHVATLVDNEIAGVPKSVHKSSGKVIKSIKARLKGKEGRLRGNLMGKRVDFSARTVISPDPLLRVDEVGVPVMIAQNLTFPERVTPYNLKRMEELVASGPNKYPGAKNVIKPNGDRIDLRYCQTKNLRLQLGYQVERDLIDGDLVVFNRQPTLHKMSMMGHRVKVLPHSTLRLNLSCTTPYNADFDGDEMNLHVPQSLNVVAEVEYLQLTTRQIITPQSSRPVMGIVQDALTGAQKLTRRDQFIDRAALMNMIMHITTWDGKIPKPAILKPIPLWTGKQLFSMVIPGKLNLIRNHSSHPDEEDDNGYKWISVGDTKVLIEQGILLSGIFCCHTLGKSSGSLMHVAMMELGHEVTGIFYNDIQNVVNSWLRVNAHSVGFKDAILEPEAETKVKDILKQAKEKVQHVPLDTLKTGEREINSILNSAMYQAGNSVQRSLDDTNNLKVMVTAGSKGSLINIAQITACIGQLNLEGKRIAVNDEGRTLPHFSKNCNTPESRGFVKNSFFRGLDPHEYFFQSMAGRDGLIDTAVKTAKTGYIQRRLMKAMESFMVQYDGTVRNAVGHIVQFCYGEDGLAGEKVEFQRLPIIQCSDEEFLDGYKFDLDSMDTKRLQVIFTDDVVQFIESDAKVKSALAQEWRALLEDRKCLRKILPDEQVVLPCNIRRMVWNVKQTCGGAARCDLNPADVVLAVNDLLAKCNVVLGDGALKARANKNATYLFGCLVRTWLCSKNICVKQRLSSAAFKQLLTNIEAVFQQAKVEPGEMVGSIAAQSIGEPAMQMTLNTFHFAGVSSKNVTLGIPRFDEIINTTKKTKAPSMTIFLKEEYSQDKDKAFKILTRLKSTKLSDLIVEGRVFHEPDLLKSILPEDGELLERYSIDEIELKKLYPWVLRLVLNKKEFCNSKLKMEDLAERITSELPEKLGKMYCIHSDDNDEVLILRLHLYRTANAKTSAIHQTEKRLRFIESWIKGISLKGLDKVTNVFMRQTSAQDGKHLRMCTDERGAMLPVPEWILETEGTDLLRILADRDVDSKRTLSNDIWDTYNTLGIEAARKVIEMELRIVFRNYGLYVNYRHISLLCDTMTSKGHLVSITRHGINSLEVGPLMRCTFEQSGDVLIEAAVHSERDHIRGVSENIIVGQMPRMGSGAFDLLMDVTKCSEAKVIPYPMKTHTAFDEHIKTLAAVTTKAKCVEIRPTSPLYSPATSGYPATNSTYAPESPPYCPSAVSYSACSPPYNPSSSEGYFVASPPPKNSSPLSAADKDNNSLAVVTESPSATLYNSSPNYAPQSPELPEYVVTLTKYSPTSTATPSVDSIRPQSPEYNPSLVYYSAISPPYNPSTSYQPRTPSIFSPIVVAQSSPSGPSFRSIFDPIDEAEQVVECETVTASAGNEVADSSVAESISHVDQPLDVDTTDPSYSPLAPTFKETGTSSYEPTS